MNFDKAGEVIDSPFAAKSEGDLFVLLGAIARARSWGCHVCRV